jgi:Tfp pilus assembly PilM family ATPase
MMKPTSINNRTQEDIIGLDINHGRIVASHFSIHDRQPRLDRLAVGEFPPELTDRQLAAWIRSFWRKEKLPTRTVRTCLHSRSLIVRYFHYQNLTVNELPQTLALEAEEALQQPADKLCVDWHLNPSEYADPSHSPAELSGTLVVAPRKTVVRHINLIRDAGLYAINVDVSCAALYNFYSYFNEDKNLSPVCLINLADRTADIMMLSESGIYPRALFSADNCWGNNTSYLIENIQNALLYYHLKTKQYAIEKIILIGQIRDQEPFSQALAKKTVLPVSVLDIHSDSRLVIDNQKLSLPASYNVTTGIGLALGRYAHEAA